LGYGLHARAMKILFAYDGSENAAAAIEKAADLVEKKGAEAIVLAVWEPLTVHALQTGTLGGPLAVPLDVVEIDDASEQHAKELAERGAQLAEKAGFSAKAAWGADASGVPESIVARADELDADLVVLGARGLAGVRAYLGSVSNHVLQHAHRPVLVVPPAKSD
jgi:nucleotide-binding universal stress UspA family protein